MIKSIHLEEIPYCPDSCLLFERIRDLPEPAMLDSSFPHSTSGRFDILTANPLTPAPQPPPDGSSSASVQSWFTELEHFHRTHFADTRGVSEELPFCGGLLGYIGYDLGNGLHDIDRSLAASPFPHTHIAAYDWCIVQDHLLRRSVLVLLPRVSESVRTDLRSRLRHFPRPAAADFSLHGEFSANFTADDYRKTFAQVQAYIEAGDCYQVNLAQCFSARYAGDPWQAYRQLRGVAAAPFSAYLEPAPNRALINLSPERFLTLQGRRVETSPIKGTRPRYDDPTVDALAAQELRGSEKDRAENLMIVDLLRNDLGRSCVPGSIHVERLFEIESFPTVHHLVSTISGELATTSTPWQLLRNCFPGGSITGAPKRRSMQIIAELEPRNRSAYCGSVMYVSADGRMDSNIAIRSLICDGENVHCWGGGGLVADSQWQLEYQETLDKVGRFMSLLESLSGARD
ncbi:MAG: aminodeoxychorismate synthase component I [Pseudomonadota bacterium]